MTLFQDKNEGILTIATSNHPELIDDAILNRPSRFDVKYTFRLPSYELRKAYIAKWIVKTKDLHGIEFKNELFLREMAEQTEGFSFAFLKELCVSTCLFNSLRCLCVEWVQVRIVSSSNRT